jgi:UDP-glucuronate 4-epimerase
MRDNRYLITGTAGFIGFHLAKRLLNDGESVLGIDSINDYYDQNLKFERLKILKKYGNWKFIKGDLVDREFVSQTFNEYKPEIVVNLAAQAGVRFSLEKPHAYIDSNISAFLNVLEGCRWNNVKHLVFASSSSVYGLNKKLPFSTKDNIDHPISLYAASKKSNELMAHSYSHLFKIPVTGLRFFSAYGPWGRPDMALFIFTKSILEGKPIQVYNHGQMKRDFTYIDDIVEGIVRVAHSPPKGDQLWDPSNPHPGRSVNPYKVYNIGNNNPIKLMDFIEIIENKLGIKAKKEFVGMQLGDVESNYANVDDLVADTGFCPTTPVKEGVSMFIDWFKEYYKN